MNFVLESQIWDLHIHTNKCPLGSDEFAKDYKNNTDGFIDKLISIFNKQEYDNLSMISFTDHNQISLEVYQEFYDRNHRITLIPGVEISYITDKNDKISKHLLVYFDADKISIKDLSDKINHLLKDTRENNKFYKIQDLLPELYHLGYNFLISPHFLKQNERGLDFDWNETDFTKIDSKLYSDQFFCFWESGGLSSMSKAQKFLQEFEISERISIVHFSDSNSFAKLITYLNSPTQYFHSLPSFKGLALVGSDCTRIRKHYVNLDKSKFSNYIGTIVFNGQTINLSNQLNSIIGGRGSGKSVLLDSVALKLGRSIGNDDRKKYLLNNSIELFDFNDNPINIDFKIEYYQQAYISDIFNSKDFYQKLREKFNEVFDLIPNIDANTNILNNKTKFSSFVNDDKNPFSENLPGLNDTFYILSDDDLDIKIKKGMLLNIPKAEDIINIDSALSNVDNKFSMMFPKQIINQARIIRLKNVLKYFILMEAKKYNLSLIKEKYSINELINVFLEYKDEKSDLSKLKSEMSKKVTDQLLDISQHIIYRNSIVQAIIETTKGFKSKYCNYSNRNGSIRNRFIFSKELFIQNPIEFFIDCLEKHFDKNKVKQHNISISIENFPRLSQMFIFYPEKLVKESSTVELLVQDVVNFELSFIESSNIYYVEDNGAIKNIKDLSPGYKTNILMEYIVYKNTTLPLLIDQPEDNVDNQTIYNQLKKWFTSMKFKRQVIVVTHDANIVINADSENIILAKQVSENNFEYFFGALEYDNMIENAALILDGGKEAVQRRLTKYES